MPKKFSIPLIFITVDCVVALVMLLVMYIRVNRSQQETARLLVDAQAQTTRVAATASAQYEADMLAADSLNSALASITNQQSTSEAVINRMVATKNYQDSVMGILRLELVCRLPYTNISYTSDTTVSSSLKTFIKNKGETVTNASWQKVWGNSSTTIHKVSGKYLYVFVVYYTRSGYSNSVWDVTNHCWLDNKNLPKY